METIEQQKATIKRLWEILPKDQIDKVFSQKECDISGDFIGFIDIYENLSEIIPKHFTVIDLGCAYNPQCFYFKDHKQYIAVDFSDCEKFKSDNCVIYVKTIQQFIVENLKDFKLSETFAICSYVPEWYNDNRKLVRDVFENLFIYYPHGGAVVVPNAAK